MNLKMYRHSPVRNQRSKGIKIKHVLQICLLVAVCFWLIFQVKRSHDKKKEFDATELKTQSSNDEIIKFGRKDLQPKFDKTTKEIEKHEEEDEIEEDDKIVEEKDDEADENEQEKLDSEVDQDDDNTLDEDKDREESDENENEEIDGEGQNETENENSSDARDQDGVTRNTHEAREEQYKADDASSAVTHDTQHENGTSIENFQVGVSEHEDPSGNSRNSTIDISEKDGENRATSNSTRIQEIGSELVNSSSEHSPPLNTTMITSSSTEATNTTDGVTVLNSSIASSDDTTQNMGEKSLNSTNISEVVDSQAFSKSTTEENSSGSSQTETRNVTKGTQENENPQKVQLQTIDSTGLEGTEGGKREDIAVE